MQKLPSQQKNPPAQTRTGGSTLVTYTNYAAGRSVIDATPAATFRPFSPSMLSGCSSISRDEPPIKALAGAPKPTEAPAVGPPQGPASAPAWTSVVGTSTAQTITPLCK